MKKQYIQQEVYYDDLPCFIPQAGISVCQKDYSVFRNPDHTTTCIEYILSGHGTIMYDGKKYEPEPGNSFMLISGKEQHYYTSPSDPWVKLWINIKGPLPQKLSEAYEINGKIIFNCDVSPYIMAIHEILRNNILTKEQMLYQTSLNIHKIIHEFYNVTHNNADDKVSKEALKIKKYIEKNVNKPLTIAELSNILYKSPVQVNRIFKENYNITPYEFYTNLKINYAKIYLETSTLAIKLISHLLGFSNERYFSELFKSKTGLTPTEYRNSKHKNNKLL